MLQERDCANRRYKEGASPRLKSATLRSLMSQQTRKTLGGGDREARKTKFLLLQEMQDRKDREAPSGKSSTFLFYLCFYLLLLALPTQLHIQDFLPGTSRGVFPRSIFLPPSIPPPPPLRCGEKDKISQALQTGGNRGICERKQSNSSIPSLASCLAYYY